MNRHDVSNATQLQPNCDGRLTIVCDPPQRLELPMLPDEILVRIGISVGKLCGIRDFVSLSRVSKRMKRLLIDSEATVSSIVRIRTATIYRSNMLPSNLNFSIETLKELSLLETLASHGILTENRIHFDFADLQIADRDSHSRIEVVRTLLNRFPWTSVVLEAHCGTPAPTEIAWMYSHYRGKVVRRAILGDTEEPLAKGRVVIRAWGKMITERVSRSDHPYGALAREGRGWVEIFVRMEHPETGKILEFPVRPDFYNRTSITPREYTTDHQE